jgi:hypothetical protein
MQERGRGRKKMSAALINYQIGSKRRVLIMSDLEGESGSSSKI